MNNITFSTVPFFKHFGTKNKTFALQTLNEYNDGNVVGCYCFNNTTIVLFGKTLKKTPDYILRTIDHETFHHILYKYFGANVMFDYDKISKTIDDFIWKDK